MWRPCERRNAGCQAMSPAPASTPSARTCTSSAIAGAARRWESPAPAPGPGARARTPAAARASPRSRGPPRRRPRRQIDRSQARRGCLQRRWQRRRQRVRAHRRPRPAGQSDMAGVCAASRCRRDRRRDAIAIHGRHGGIAHRRGRAADRRRVLQLQRQRVLARAPERGRGLDDLALLGVGVAEVAPGALVVGRQANRHLQLGQRLVHVPELERDQPQVAARVRVLRRRAAISRYVACASCEPAQLVTHQRQQVQRLQFSGASDSARRISPRPRRNASQRPARRPMRDGSSRVAWTLARDHSRNNRRRASPRR